MSDFTGPPARVLAIDPISRGFGYAVLEGPEMLVDWGICNVRGSDLPATLERITNLIVLYRPDALITEDCSAGDSRRRQRARALINGVAQLATIDMPAHSIPVSALRKLFGDEHTPATKHTTATAIAEHFTELAHRLPPPRKPWMPQDPRMGIFDATGLALVFYVLGKCKLH